MAQDIHQGRKRRPSPYPHKPYVRPLFYRPFFTEHRFSPKTRFDLRVLSIYYRRMESPKRVSQKPSMDSLSCTFCFRNQRHRSYSWLPALPPRRALLWSTLVLSFLNAQSLSKDCLTKRWMQKHRQIGQTISVQTKFIIVDNTNSTIYHNIKLQQRSKER